LKCCNLSITEIMLWSYRFLAYFKLDKKWIIRN